MLREAGAIARLDYLVTCDPSWRARTAEVRGWWGERAVDLRIERRGEQWSVDGVAAQAVDGLVDLDLGFTPATNLTLLRRLDLELGQAADVDVAWIDLGRGTLTRLTQRYERRSATTYAYEAPSFGYSALLEVGPEGFVVRYPDLWQAE